MVTCTRCGAASPDGSPTCIACGAPLTGSQSVQVEPIATPLREAEPSAAAPVGAPAEAPSEFASLGDRALGALLDLLALGAAFWATGSWLAPRFGGTTPTGFSLTGLPAVLTMGLSLVAWLAYSTCLEWWFGATPGKWVAGAKVLGPDGRRPSFRPALVRNLARIVDILGVYLVGAIAFLVTRKHQRLGDLFAGTVVVRRSYHAVARVAALLLALALPVVAVVGSLWLRPAGETVVSTGAAEAATPGAAGAAESGVVQRGAAAGAAGTRPSVVVLAGGSAPVDGPLSIGEFRLVAGRDGPERADGRFKPGERVALVFKLAGLAADGAASSAGHVRMTINAFDPFRTAVVEQAVQENRPELTAGGIDSWAQFTLPDYCLPGEHRLELTIEDLVASRRVFVAVPFTVDAAPHEPSEVLVLRLPRFTEGEDGPERASATYAVGDTVWMAFQLVGFRPGPEGQVRLRLNMTIASASGESLGDLSLLTLDQRFFYLPRRIPATAHVSLGSTPPGQYVATLKAIDEVGGQKAEYPLRFTIAK